MFLGVSELIGTQSFQSFPTPSHCFFIRDGSLVFLALFVFLLAFFCQIAMFSLNYEILLDFRDVQIASFPTPLVL